MHLKTLRIENFRCFGEGEDSFEIVLAPGLTALVGENEAGKTAVIDALRLSLGTTDQEWCRLEDSDVHCRRRPPDDLSEEHGEDQHQSDVCPTVRITCMFAGLTAQDKRAFLEHLTYGEEGKDEHLLFVNWVATDTGRRYKGRLYRRVEVRSGRDGNGPSFAPEVRELLRATYLRPLRDADQALSAGHGSRLSQILQNTAEIKNSGDKYHPNICYDTEKLKQLHILGIGDLANDLLKQHKGITTARDRVDDHLKKLSFHADSLRSSIKVGGADAKEDVRLRQLLEKLDISLQTAGKAGLGSSNLLFIACELLLIGGESEGNRMLLIEEPEAHVHAQRQLQMMRFMEQQAKEKGIQIIITTHSPNLASVIDLDSIVMIHNGRAFPMAKGHTELEPSDYPFLARFLDVTKANLFFARGVMIVEGDAENILIPTLAHLIDRDYTEHAVSIVNVGGVGLHRYARIFRRKQSENAKKHRLLDIPVACVTDMDVMPNCAPRILGKLKEGDTWPEISRQRRWRAKRDFLPDDQLKTHRGDKEAKATGQRVKTFVSEEWTFEYDLALGRKDKEGRFSARFAEDVFIAACLADEDDKINAGAKTVEIVEAEARIEFASLRQEADSQFASWKKAGEEGNGYTVEEVLASKIYARFAKDGVPKTIAAQYMASRLQGKCDKGELTSADLRAGLPKYLVDAIDYVTAAAAKTAELSEGDK